MRQGSLVVGKVILMGVASLLVFWPALHGGWIGDEVWYLPDRQWRLWSSDTLGYHLASVALHFLSALLVWRLLDKLGLKLAWLGGMIFAVHPVQVESVACIVELKSTLSLPPLLLAMMAWVDFEENRSKRDYLLALGWFLVATLCQITLAPFPVLILLYGWWKRGRVGWAEVKVSVPFFFIALTFGMYAIWVEEMYALPDPIPLGGVFSRIVCAGTTLGFYFTHCFSPAPQLPVYPQWVVDPPNAVLLWPWVVMVGVGYLCWRQRRSWGRHALFGLGFFVLFLVPFLGFMPLSYMSFTWVRDPVLYLPIIGLIGLVVAFLEWGEGKVSAGRRMPLLGIVVLGIAVLGWRSHDYAARFMSPEKLWTYTIGHNPDAWPAYQNLGNELLRRGDATRALAFFAEVVRRQPGYAEGHDDLGIALEDLHQMPEAIAQFEQALKLNPDDAKAREQLIKLHAQ